MKTKLLLLAALLLAIGQTFGQAVKTLPYYDSFNYTESSLFTTGSADGAGEWYLFGSVAATGNEPLITTSVISNVGILPAPTDTKAITFVGSGDDGIINFTDPGATNVNVYASFVFRIESPVSPLTEVTTNAASASNFIFSLGRTNSANTGINYASTVMLRRTNTVDPATFELGIAETNSIATGIVQWSGQTINYDTDVVVVVKYETGPANPVNPTVGTSYMWINPTNGTGIEPTATLNTSSDTTTGVRYASSGSESNLNKARLNLNSNAGTPNIMFDELRIANTWWQVIGKTSDPSLSVTKNDIEGLKVYPNPVKDGKLFISSASTIAKQVAIYNVLGAQVLKKEVTSGLVDVSSLNKGVYVLKITEAGKTSTRKVVID